MKSIDGKMRVRCQVEWYGTNGLKIVEFLYNNLKEDDLFLERKFKKQIKARKIYKEAHKPKLWRRFEKKFNLPMEIVLRKLFVEEKLN